MECGCMLALHPTKLPSRAQDQGKAYSYEFCMPCTPDWCFLMAHQSAAGQSPWSCRLASQQMCHIICEELQASHYAQASVSLYLLVSLQVRVPSACAQVSCNHI